MATPRPHPTKTKPRRLLLRFLPPALIVLAALGIYLFVDFTTVSDWFRSLGFQPTAEVAQIISDIQLTSRGDLIMRAARPTIEGNPTFTEHCGDDHAGTSILGCYTGDHIYIKNITDPDLAGILESTSAHELLHAVWSRLDQPARTALGADLTALYRQHQDTLGDRLTHYEESRWHDELHSIIGTEYLDLPPALATHYSQFFTDRARIISYYDAYNSKFQTLLAESKALESQIAALRAQISADTESYEASATELQLAIADFNRRAASGAFTSEAAFYAERRVLERRTTAITALYNSINTQITEVNRLVDLYNANAAALSDLSDAISTPPAPPTV